MRHRTHESCKGPTASSTRARGPAAGSLGTPLLLPLPGAHPCGCQAASVRAPAAEPGPEAPGRGSPGLSRRPLLPGQRAGARSSPSRGTPEPPGGWFLLQPPGTNNRCAGAAHGEGHAPAHASLQWVPNRKLRCGEQGHPRHPESKNKPGDATAGTSFLPAPTASGSDLTSCRAPPQEADPPPYPPARLCHSPPLHSHPPGPLFTLDFEIMVEPQEVATTYGEVLCALLQCPPVVTATPHSALPQPGA